MIKPTRNFRLKNREFAQTMVEFALVFPIILLITYGIIEFGRMVFIYAAVTGAAREGARYGAANGDLVDPFFRDCPGILDAVQRGAILTPIDTVNDVDIWYDSGPGTPHILDGCPPDFLDIELGDRIGVNVTAHFEPIIPFLGLSGFDIESENARTILTRVQIEGTPVPYP
jgi:hypothetical protein